MSNTHRFIEMTVPAFFPEGVAAGVRGRDRLPAFIGMRADAPPVLDGLKVLVVGSGGVGRGMILDLARLGIALIGICDQKKYKPQSIQTQAIGPAEVNGWKGELTARACKEISPDTRVLYYNGPFQELTLADLAQFDLVIMTTDNLPTEIEIGLRCHGLGIPLLNAAVHGDTLVAQVRFFSNRESGSPCPACGFGAVERAQMNEEVVFSCEGAPPENAVPEFRSAPTVSTSSLCAIGGNLAMMQLLRFVIGLGEPVEDTILEYCGYTHRTVTSPLKSRPDCVCDHARYERASAPRPLAECSLAELSVRAGLPLLGDDPANVTVGDRRFAESGVCECGNIEPVHRFVGPDETRAGRCSTCDGSSLHCQRSFLHRPVSPEFLGSTVEEPLRGVGAPEPEWVLLQNSTRAVFFLNP